MANNYDDSSIVVVEDDVEKIKTAPGMYIGYRKWEAVLHFIREVVQNSIDELVSTKKKNATIQILMDPVTKRTSVIDCGRGAPLGSLEKIVTYIQSSGKFSKGGKNAYGKVAGMNGIGITAVNALSTDFEITSIRDNTKRSVQFEFGHKVSENEEKYDTSKTTGTIVSFIPNEEIIGKCKYDCDSIRYFIKMISYLTPGITYECIEVKKNGKQVSESYLSKNGIIDRVNELVGKEALFKPVYFKIDNGDDEDALEVAFTYVPDSQNIKEDVYIQSCVNYCETSEGGTHVDGFRQGIATAVTKYVKEKLNKSEAKKLNVNADDARMGLVAVINVTTLSATFSGQIKAKLISEGIEPFVRQNTVKEVNKWLKSNEKQSKKLVEWVKTNTKIRQRASEERKVSLNKDGFNAFAKDKIKGLTMCTSKKAEECELFVVEGKSASGSAKTGRDGRTQAIIELRGVPKNTIDQTMVASLQNEEIRSIVRAIGTNYGKNFDIKKANFSRIIILSDADKAMSAFKLF